jgi:hypothetical protein
MAGILWWVPGARRLMSTPPSEAAAVAAHAAAAGWRGSAGGFGGGGKPSKDLRCVRGGSTATQPPLSTHLIHKNHPP